MSFTIRGCASGRIVVQTRLRPASASVLAMKWLSQGICDVRIEYDGRSLDLTQFQRRFSVTRKGVVDRPWLVV